jgi:hypothetical protein
MTSIDRKIMLYEQTKDKIGIPADYLAKRDFLLGEYIVGFSIFDHCKAQPWEISSELGIINPNATEDRLRVNHMLFQLRGGDYRETDIEEILPLYTEEEQEHQLLSLKTSAYMHLCGYGQLTGEALKELYEEIPEPIKNVIAWTNEDTDCSQIDTLVLDERFIDETPIERILYSADECHLLTLHAFYRAKEDKIYTLIIKQLNGKMKRY